MRFRRKVEACSSYLKLITTLTFLISCFGCQGAKETSPPQEKARRCSDDTISEVVALSSVSSATLLNDQLELLRDCEVAPPREAIEFVLEANLIRPTPSDYLTTTRGRALLAFSKEACPTLEADLAALSESSSTAERLALILASCPVLPQGLDQDGLLGARTSAHLLLAFGVTSALRKMGVEEDKLQPVLFALSDVAAPPFIRERGRAYVLSRIDPPASTNAPHFAPYPEGPEIQLSTTHLQIGARALVLDHQGLDAATRIAALPILEEEIKRRATPSKSQLARLWIDRETPTRYLLELGKLLRSAEMRPMVVMITPHHPTLSKSGVAGSRLIGADTGLMLLAFQQDREAPLTKADSCGMLPGWPQYRLPPLARVGDEALPSGPPGPIRIHIGLDGFEIRVGLASEDLPLVPLLAGDHDEPAHDWERLYEQIKALWKRYPEGSSCDAIEISATPSAPVHQTIKLIDVLSSQREEGLPLLDAPRSGPLFSAITLAAPPPQDQKGSTP